ncbi:MAG TPA: ABC transporter permease [Pilimelia sp.]|nr:ABC transporter permease [Pilimelia sp.]
MVDLLAAEWLKVRSARSTRRVAIAVATVVGLMALLAWYVARLYDRVRADSGGRAEVSSPAELAAWLTALCLAVLGVRTITSEFATGMIRTSLTVAPRPGALLLAKAAVVGGIALVTGQLVTFGTALVSRGIVGDRPLGFNAEPLSAEVPVLLAAGLSVLMFAVVGVGLGAVLRSSAGAIATLCMLWYVLPIITINLPAPWSARVSSVMLQELPRQLAGAATADGLLSPLGALAGMVAYAALPLLAGAVLMRRREP